MKNLDSSENQAKLKRLQFWTKRRKKRSYVRKNCYEYFNQFLYLVKKSESEVTDQPRRSDTSNSRRSFPKPDLLPVNSSAGPSSESGPDAPVILNPQVGLRKLIEKVESEDNEIEEMDTSQLIERLGFHK